MEYALSITALVAICWYVRAAQVRANFQQVAQRVGGQFTPTGLWSSGRVTLQYGKVRITIVDVPGPLCWSPKLVFSAELALPDLSEVPHHMPLELRTQLGELRRLTGDREPKLELHRGGARLIVSASAYFDTDIAHLLPTAQAALRELLQWLAKLAESAGKTGAHADDAQLGVLCISPEQAHCPVCGTVLDSEPGQMVQQACLCPVCRTPHHLDCWQYNHGCAVYGCRCSGRQRKAARKPPRVD